MADVGSAIAPANGALAGRVERLRVARKAASFHDETALRGEDAGISRITGWHNAIKLVDTAGYALDEVTWSSHPHQVARSILHQAACCELRYVVGERLRLAHRETPQSVTLESDFLDFLGTLASQRELNAALHNSVKGTAERILEPIG